MADEIEVRPKDPEAARAEIERTRARMSETIDEIEGVLLKKKSDIQDRFDVVRRIRARPLPAAGIALGVGLLLGFLTGGGKKERPRLADDDRAALWEARARRLLSIAREQEADIEVLEDEVAELSGRLEARSAWRRVAATEYPDRGSSRISEWREVARDRLELLGDAGRDLVDRVRRVG